MRLPVAKMVMIPSTPYRLCVGCQPDKHGLYMGRRAAFRLEPFWSQDMDGSTSNRPAMS